VAAEIVCVDLELAVKVVDNLLKLHVLNLGRLGRCREKKTETRWDLNPGQRGLFAIAQALHAPHLISMFVRAKASPDMLLKACKDEGRGFGYASTHPRAPPQRPLLSPWEH
jgi:hypothetical protein